jgi:diadenosine tetraphosphate (Ap4A) HIT family hydrolase
MKENGNGTGGAIAAPCSDRATPRVDRESSINHKAILSRGVGYRPAVAGDWRDDRVGSAHRGENPLVMARMRGGFAVIGDTQHLAGYSLLLTDDPSVNHLTDLDWERRTQFLFDLSLLGEAVGLACRDNGLRRINYEVLGNSLPILHGHVHARYEWEPPDRIDGPVWRYPPDERNDPACAYSDATHGELRAAITEELNGLTERAYQRPATRGRPHPNLY